MKKLFLLLALFAGTTVILHAQNEIVFEYDDTGNRLSREIKPIILPSEEASATDSVTVAEESLFNLTIKAYPNPTFGQLTIEIEDFEVDTPLELVVFDRAGLSLERHVVKSSVIYLDLSPYPPATWYMVAFILNGERRDFKIIKL